MHAGLESKIIRRGFGALLLSGVLLVAGATAATADDHDDYSDGDGYGCEYDCDPPDDGGCDYDDCYPPDDGGCDHDCYPPTTTTPPTPVDHPGGHDRTYPVPPPPQAPPGNPDNPPSPPVLARTGSNTGTIAGIGAGAVLVGGGLVVLARKRRLATVTD